MAAVLTESATTSQIAPRKKLYTVYTVPGDGNCLYRSILASLAPWPSERARARGTKHAQAVLRAHSHLVPPGAPDRLPDVRGEVAATSDAMVRWLRFVCAASIVEHKLFEYATCTPIECVRNALTMGECADHLEIMAICHALNIRVGISGPSTSHTVVQATAPNQRTRNARVAYDGAHYNALVHFLSRQNLCN